MGDKEKDSLDSDRHAWRRKPRKFAPKSRLGCKTCKIRRIKCDLGRPSCSRCHSTGRKCDGYGDVPVATTKLRGHYSSASSESAVSDDFPTSITRHQQSRWLAQYSNPVRHSVGPLTVLPCAGPSQSLAMYFFEYVSINHLNEFRPSEPWRRSLMLYAQTVPAVQHAATALALVHRDHLDHGVTDKVYQLQAFKGRSSFDAPLFYYNRAIRFLLDQKETGATETTAITLLVCYLLMCFDLLAGNYVQATNHLRGGVELARNVDVTLHRKKASYNDIDVPAADSLLDQVIEQVNRLDTQAVIFLLDWNPTITHESLMAQLPVSGDVFLHKDQAADHMQTLIARIARHRNMALFSSEQMAVSSAQARDSLDTQLERWRSLFERSMRQDSFKDSQADSHPLIPLLRLQYIIARILLETNATNAEMEYDNFLPQFRQAMTLAHQVADTHVRYSGSRKPTFTPEIAFAPVLFIIGSKCRDPFLRRDAVGILRRQPMREAVWDSIISAIVLERIIEIEEGGLGQIMTMQQVPVYQRVEIFDWIHYPGAEPRLDITYNISGMEKMCTESLPL